MLTFFYIYFNLLSSIKKKKSTKKFLKYIEAVNIDFDFESKTTLFSKRIANKIRIKSSYGIFLKHSTECSFKISFQKLLISAGISYSIK